MAAIGGKEAAMDSESSDTAAAGVDFMASRTLAVRGFCVAG